MKENTWDYSPGISIILKFLAPAVAERFMSILIFASNTMVVADLFWKTLVFLSFPIAQLTSMVTDAITLGFWVEGQVMDVYQPFIEGSAFNRRGRQAASITIGNGSITPLLGLLLAQWDEAD